MKILLINNEGGGFADHIDIDEGTSVAVMPTAGTLYSSAQETMTIDVQVSELPMN